MTHDHYGTLRRLLEECWASLPEAPAYQRAALIRQAAEISDRLYALDSAAEGAEDVPGHVAPVTPLQVVQEHLAERRQARRGL